MFYLRDDIDTTIILSCMKKENEYYILEDKERDEYIKIYSDNHIEHKGYDHIIVKWLDTDYITTVEPKNYIKFPITFDINSTNLDENNQIDDRDYHFEFNDSDDLINLLVALSRAVED